MGVDGAAADPAVGSVESIEEPGAAEHEWFIA